MGMTMGTTSHGPSVVHEDICALVLDACDLVERYADLPHADQRVEREARLLRAELCAALGGCEDDVAADDGHGAVAELDALLARLAGLPERQVALSA
jgi:hypothetical protein